MNTIDIKDIKILPRQRKNISEKKVEDLALSIQTLGLFTPVLLTTAGELIAGEHRLRAVSSLHQQGIPIKYDGSVIKLGQIPFILLDSESLHDRKSAELHENIKRVQLTWQEEADAIAELHSIRSEQAAARGETQSFKSTASEIMQGFNTLADNHRVSQAILIAKHLDDPEVKGAENTSQALRIIEKKAIQAQRRLHAEVFGGTIGSQTTFVNEDVEHYLQSQTSLPYQILVADPPYGIDADTFGSQFAADHQYQDSSDYAWECVRLLGHTMVRMVSDRAAAFIFCDVTMWKSLHEYLTDALESTPWKLWNAPLIWNKYPQGALPVPSKGPRAGYECILYAYSGNIQWTKTGCPDVISIPGVQRPEFGAQKPPELFTWLFEAVTLPGDSILDLFAGTCPSSVAASKMFLPITCVEMNNDKLLYATERLRTGGV